MRAQTGRNWSETGRPRRKDCARSTEDVGAALERALPPVLPMNSIKGLMVVAPLTGLFGACYSHMASDSAMHEALEDAEAENQRHAGVCDSTPSMPDMMNELDRHENSMIGLMVRMDEARRRMGSGSMGMGGGHCSGPSFEHMSLTLDSMHPAMSDHIVRMREAQELATARAECAGHTDAMAEMMRGMMNDVESMSCMN